MGIKKRKVSDQEQSVLWQNSYLSELLKYVKRAECPTSCETDLNSISITYIFNRTCTIISSTIFLKHCLLQYLVDYTNGQSNLSVISLSHSCSQVSQGNQLSGQWYTTHARDTSPRTWVLKLLEYRPFWPPYLSQKSMMNLDIYLKAHLWAWRVCVRFCLCVWSITEEMHCLNNHAQYLLN